MGKNWAIAIGVNHYDNLQPLRYAQRDADAMKAWFQQEAKFDQVFLFTDNSPSIPTTGSPISTKPTYGRLRRFFRAQFEQSLLQPGDNFWFFFAGHGKRYAERDYLMLSDSDPGDIENSALSVSWITQRLRRCGADNIVMFLDACRDIGARDGTGIGTEQQQGVITFYACSPNQQSYEIEQLDHGSFTHALLESLQIQGEGNCATVERLYQRLRYRVKEINQQHQKPLQTTYAVIEPASKFHLILLPDYATLNDIAQLKLDAYQAEVTKDWELARQLWIRVNVAARGSDAEAINAFSRIGYPQSSTTESNSESASSSTRGTGETVESSTQREAQQQQEAKKRKQQEQERIRQQQEVEQLREQQKVQYRQRFSQAVEQEFPLSEATRKQLRNLQQSLQLSNEEVSQIEQSIVDRKEIERKRQQQEAQRLREQQEAQRCKQQEAEARVIKEVLETRTFEFHVATLERKSQFLGIANRWVINRRKQQTTGIVEVIKPGIELELMEIPAGSFTMGAPETEKGSSDSERPQHQVTVQSFFMGKYPVTQAEWKAVAALDRVNCNLETDPSSFKGDNRPVERVSWYDAVEFCARLSNHTSREYRLPSEAEWEYACRAGTTTPFHFGETITSELANYDANYTYGGGSKRTYRKETTVVESFDIANAFGLYDTHGNVWEWCLDDWHDNYDGAPTDGSAWMNENNNLSQAKGRAVLRGGSWVDYPIDCRSAFRYNFDGSAGRGLINDSIGFRVVCTFGKTYL